MQRANVIVTALDGHDAIAAQVAQRLAQAWTGGQIPNIRTIAAETLNDEKLSSIDAAVIVAGAACGQSVALPWLGILQDAGVPVLALLDSLAVEHDNVFEFAGALIDLHCAPGAQLCTLLRGLLHRQSEVRQLRQEVAISQRFHGGLKTEIAKMHEELQLAALVQREFLPREVPSLHGVEFAALWRPTNYVSGDLYDIIRLDEDHVGVFIADAVGHGVPAALMTMVISRSLNTKEISGGSYRLVPPSEVLLRLNAEMIRRQGRTTRFERQLRETRDFFELTLNAVPTPINYFNRDFVMTYSNRAFEEWLGVSAAKMIGKGLRELLPTDMFSLVMPYVDKVMAGERVHSRHTAMRHGIMREWQNHYVPQVDANGAVLGFFSIIYDLTEQRRLEARLLQAQKMEAIGQLTGGIAHDFNNLLGVVIGNLQLLERSVAETPTLARKVHTAMRAAVRGADLTRRLLAFARRQILDPVVVDANRQLSGLSELMQRTLGESVEVHMVQAHDLWHTRVDAGQFENAILNLAINARDAMPEGGRLTVRTRNVYLDSIFCSDHPEIEPGEFVSISVSDTGAGIEPEVLKRVFEPFFTTKESGRGSGLGLAMVDSFSEQAGGVATIESAVGQGTTVTILLPRCMEEQVTLQDTIVTKIAPGGNETILVVEDDADLRETVVTALTQLGYRSLSAPNANAALRILAGTEHIDLLFTDIMMPGGMLGPALAVRARELRPDIDILFTTGYADNSALAGQPGLTASDVITKPYRNEDLATRIRHVLDREARVA
jgi:PAS domain S-box-containing protein